MKTYQLDYDLVHLESGFYADSSSRQKKLAADLCIGGKGGAGAKYDGHCLYQGQLVFPDFETTVPMWKLPGQ